MINTRADNHYPDIRGWAEAWAAAGLDAHPELARHVSRVEALRARLDATRQPAPADTRAAVVAYVTADDDTAADRALDDARGLDVAEAERETRERWLTDRVHDAEVFVGKFWRRTENRDRLVIALRDPHTAAVNELAALLAEHSGLAAMTAETALDRPERVRKAWRRRNELIEHIKAMETLAREIRGPADRFTRIKPWEFTYAELPDRLRRGWEQRVSDPRNGGTRPRHVPTLAEALAAGARRYLPTLGDLARLDAERQANRPKPAGMMAYG